jgi:hypothetical protein
MIAYTTRSKKADFAAEGSASNYGALFGAVGGAIGGAMKGMSAVERGNKLVADENIADPADAISLELAKGYAAEHGGLVARAPINADQDQPEKLASAGDGASYIIDVRTFRWTTRPRPRDRDKLGFYYGAILRVVDGHTGKVTVQDKCFFTPDKVAEAPTASELTADGAAVLKKMTDEDRDQCLAQFASKLNLRTASIAAGG